MKLFASVFLMLIVFYKAENITELLECKNWQNEHIFSAKDVHYYNMFFSFVKINSLNDLNITFDCKPKEFYIK